MTTVSDIFNFLNEMAPVSLAEDYDNPGLLEGNPHCEVKKALISLDITPLTAEEAANGGAQLIISHHPIIFKPISSVLSEGSTAAVWKLAQFSLSAICMHTNLDTANGGVNDALAAVLKLSNVSKLGSFKSRHYKKISVFVPMDYAEKVRGAMADAGAGKLGAYDGCAFEVQGKGYFRPLEGANPFIGKQGKYECVDEIRIEAVCAPDKVKKTVAAMLEAHPYEFPAYDVFDDEAISVDYGMGRIGLLSGAMSLKDFAEKVKSALSSACVKVVDSGKTAHKIAVLGGSADSELIKLAKNAGADTLVTGEMKHNLYYEAMEAGINIVEAGHFSTETVVLPVLKEKLSEAYPDVSFKIAKSNREPYYSV